MLSSSSCAETRAGAVTAAFAVAKLTDAATPAILLSFFSILAAHAAQVIPRIERLSSCVAGVTSPAWGTGDMSWSCLPRLRAPAYLGWHDCYSTLISMYYSMMISM
jgi:hypothetical protein